jgi:glycosyltransferase involved in cell wall biosynthesis
MPVTDLPPVSVLMPVHNGARYVRKAIESVLTQTHDNFEFLVVDDGSTDETPNILASYQQRDDRVRVVRHVNRGQPASLNRGLELATHEWVAIIDHDDICLPHRLERQLQLIARHPDVRVVGAHVIQIDFEDNQLQLGRWGVTTVEEFRERRERNDWIGLAHPSAMIHRPTILSLGGYDPVFGPTADTELWSRVADDHLILVVPEPLLLYRVHSASMTANQYFDQLVLTRWIMARQLARRSGRQVPDFEEYRASERGLWSLPKPSVAYRDWASYLEFSRGLARLERRRFASAALVLAEAAFRPRASARRLSKRLRRSRLRAAHR